MKKWQVFSFVFSFTYLLQCQKVIMATTMKSNSNSEDYPYCFRFTWLGQKFDKNSEINNLTCETFRQDIKNIPCRRPLVATSNSREPNTILLWKDFKERPLEIGCRLVRGESCVKYSYIYNQAVQNVTYMCAKVNASNGCYTQQYDSGQELQVCVCESSAGSEPCFSSTASSPKQSNLIKICTTILMVFLCLNVNI